MTSNRGLITAALTATGIGAGFLGRFLLDKLMEFYPTWATRIDCVGQGVIALLIGWFILLPILEMYGVIRHGKRYEA
jgi:hypothetical protein